jgi:Zn-finger nucleic acid-binding protein
MKHSHAELKAGDPCPQCGGTFVPDPEQDPKRLVERHSLNSPSPFVAARYKERVDAKVEEFGLIHKCTNCGYRARFHAADVKKDATPQQTGDQGRASTDQHQAAQHG